ncbi:hypothetical protein [Halorussus caseinilyticus]|uniref:hypothetical protein n=1 Tax=Halorussus caseinilyticus TaxID=3034025 RepID=UPI003A900D34
MPPNCPSPRLQPHKGTSGTVQTGILFLLLFDASTPQGYIWNHAGFSGVIGCRS